MSTNVIQTSFHAGEWAPALNARVDLQKYHSAAALLRNFFVDYRGGASTRTGTRYIIKCFRSSTAVRLIPFQASFTVNYVLEFGDLYIRFINNGAPVLETAIALTAATAASPAVFTKNTHGLSNGDWVYTTLFAGGTWSTLNGKYFIVAAATANTFQLTDLFGVAVNTTGLGTWTAGSVARVYTLVSPYTSAELPLLKYAQNVNTLVLCHPNHVPYILTLTNATSWTLAAISFSPTIGPPQNYTANTTLGAGTVHYAYRGTAINVLGEESAPSAFGTIANKLDLRSNPGTNVVVWTAPLFGTAVSYNVYKAQLDYSGAVPAGSQFGFIGNVTGTTLSDSNIQQDYSLTPPITYNPFSGSSVSSITITAGGSYTTYPSITIAAPPPGGVTATAQAVVQAISVALVSGGFNYRINDIVTLPNGVSIKVTGEGPGNSITTFTTESLGSSAVAITPNPVSQISTSGSGVAATFNITYAVTSALLGNPGSGYLGAPAVSFSPAGATATSAIGAAAQGNPTVPGYFQQRLVLAGPTGNPQQFNMSQPGSYFNFNYTDPTQLDDSIQGTLVSGQLNVIKAMVSMPAGLVFLADKQAWLINGGSAGAGISPVNITANSQAYNGISDVPPIVVNYDILYVQAKGSIVRDLAYNFNTNIYTGTDISILSSHLFYGYTITGWAYSEEPFKTIQAVRNDGTLLTLTFVKEQELVGWTHSDTQGLFNSVACVTEPSSFGYVDACYVVVQRTINGTNVQYIERFAERLFTNGARDAWCVDAGLQYNGSPATSFTGGEHLAGATVTGLADGEVITPFVMATNGNFTLAEAASVVTIGLAYTPQLQTLALDVGEPTVQGKQKKIASVTVRCQDTLGLSIGSDFDNLVAMKDLVVGNVGSLTNEEVTDLVTGDAQTVIDPKWSEQGQFCIEQSNPFPATILGVIPEIVIGDTPK